MKHSGPIFIGVVVLLVVAGIGLYIVAAGMEPPQGEITETIDNDIFPQ